MVTILDQKRLEELGEADLRALVEGGVSENRFIDYKRSLPGTQDQKRKEFLRDVSSFANTLGGYIIYGMNEDGGVAKGVCGLGVINPDQEILRMEEMLRTGLRPRVHGIALHPVPLTSGGHALVMKIPRSLSGPHQVVFDRDYRFSARGQNGKYFMEVDELRTHLTGAQTMLERCRNHRFDRIAKIAAGDSLARPMGQDGLLVIHYLPIAGFADGFRLPLKGNGLQPPVPHPTTFYWGCSSHRFRFEGFHIYRQGDNGQPADYCLVSWNGAMEVVHLVPWRNPANMHDPWRGCLITRDVELNVRHTIQYLLPVAADLGMEPPGILAVSMVGMRGWKISAGRSWDGNWQPIDHDPFLVSEVFVETDGAETDTILKGLVDPLWNTGGWNESPNFEEGAWVDPDGRR